MLDVILVWVPAATGLVWLCAALVCAASWKSPGAAMLGAACAGIAGIIQAVVWQTYHAIPDWRRAGPSRGGGIVNSESFGSICCADTMGPLVISLVGLVGLIVIYRQVRAERQRERGW